MQYLKRTWVEIDLDALAHNIGEARRLAGLGVRVMAMVKADAYGHGIRETARAFARDADWFGVSNIEEATELRRFGTDTPILIVGYTPPEYAGELARHGISQCVFSAEYAEALSAQAVRDGIELNIHLKIDTGMSRIGLPYGDIDTAEKCATLPGFRREGIFTHFASSDFDGDDDGSFTALQFARFTGMVDELKARGVAFALRHACNSGGVLAHGDMRLDMVRPGFMLYGLYPSERTREFAELRPAMALKSTVTQIHTLAVGESVSYGRAYRAESARLTAAVSAGYDDGYPRRLSGGADVLIRGRRAPVLGRICMDQFVADVTDIPGAAAGDTATLFGRDGNAEISLYELAQRAGTSPYESMCLIGRRVPRVYLRGGEVAAVTNYLLG